MHLFLQMFSIEDNKEPVSAMLFLLVDNVNTFVSFSPLYFTVEVIGILKEF